MHFLNTMVTHSLYEKICVIIKNRTIILPLLKGYEKEESDILKERLTLLEKEIEQLLQK